MRVPTSSVEQWRKGLEVRAMFVTYLAGIVLGLAYLLVIALRQA